MLSLFIVGRETHTYKALVTIQTRASKAKHVPMCGLTIL